MNSKLEKYLNESPKFDNFVKKEVIITKAKTDSKYQGTLSYYDKSKGFIVIDDLKILDKDGSVKVASKTDTKRKFDVNTIKSIKEA